MKGKRKADSNTWEGALLSPAAILERADAKRTLNNSQKKSLRESVIPDERQITRNILYWDKENFFFVFDNLQKIILDLLG